MPSSEQKKSKVTSYIIYYNLTLLDPKMPSFQVAIFHFVQFLHPDTLGLREALLHQLRRADGPALQRGADHGQVGGGTQLQGELLGLFFSCRRGFG